MDKDQFRGFCALIIIIIAIVFVILGSVAVAHKNKMDYINKGFVWEPGTRAHWVKEKK